MSTSTLPQTTTGTDGATGADEPTVTRKFLTFELDGQSYGIDVGFVTEIIGAQQVTPVPDMPPYVSGVVNLRGRVIPVMDVRLRFGMEHREPDDRTCTIVVHVEGTDVGLLVDTVQEVTDINVDQIDAPSQLRDDDGPHFIEAMAKVGSDVKLILDTAALLHHGRASR